TVTVQLPIFNEVHVVERLIDAVAALDYPRDRLEVQLLDDSTDETTALAQARVAHHRGQGLDITLLRRSDRRGYKAGALAHGLACARGELIAIFDADFVPPPDFLRRTVPFFLDDFRLGFLQTRWGHLNTTYSPLTRAQVIALDGHFVIEQTARSQSGCFINFNGTAGIWRRACIEESGGWQDDTLCEDLDLSYRAQLAGWHAMYRPDIVTPAELPPQLLAFKRQQFRWAKGSIACLRKLGSPVWHSHYSLAARIEGIIHLGSYLAHPLLLLLLLLTPPLLWWNNGVHWPLAWSWIPVSLSGLGLPLLYTASQWALHVESRQAGERWWQRLLYFPVLVLLGTGLALSNTKAVLEGWLGRGTPFRRTPKFQLEGQKGHWTDSHYVLSPDVQLIGELLLAIYATLAIVLAWYRGNFWAIPFLGLYVGGFLFVAGISLRQAWSVSHLPVATEEPDGRNCFQAPYRSSHSRSLTSAWSGGEGRKTTSANARYPQYPPARSRHPGLWPC
ncbi:MAG TPA: glycosyltransferase, partial [Anaerolineae bacterium]|nr:glycosyltransferase [Anaerolineae bacterium]HIQ05702.1 glycosyltransferase [Anaerolineae bacterium]